MSAHRYDELSPIFQPVFDRIAGDTVRREQEHELPHQPVQWLREAGFGRVRVPLEHGGLGASLQDLVRLLIDLGEADSNLPQLWRGHLAFVEALLHDSGRDPVRWFPPIVGGVIFGNAQAERASNPHPTTLRGSAEEGWVLDGEKFYSTGSIFADWLWVTASLEDGTPVGVSVEATLPGVIRLDDWDGFGQQLTGSGTTRFEGVAIDDADVLVFAEDRSREHSEITVLYQLILLSALAGIGRAVLRDAIDFVRPRSRTFGVVGDSSPREDPLVQRIVGSLASLSFSADTAVLAVTDRLAAAREVTDAEEGFQRQTRVEIDAFSAQQVVTKAVLDAATQLFEVGGASATSRGRALDRHWRNARTLSSHNPSTLRERAIGDYFLNGTVPNRIWKQVHDAQREAAEATAARG